MNDDLPKQQKKPWFNKISGNILSGLGGLSSAVDPRARDALTTPNTIPEVLASAATRPTVDSYAAAEAAKGQKRNV